jgi:GTPase
LTRRNRASGQERIASDKERAFLVGLEYRTRRLQQAARTSSSAVSDADGGGTRLGFVPPSARAARDAAESRVHADGVESVPFTSEESMAELNELATSAGAEVVGEFLQHRDRPDPATLIGRGKLEELSGAVKGGSADLVIFDHELSPSQQRNLEREIDCRVIDRTQLILDIFARHARTREGQLQVELAQLEYLLPRLAGRGVEMSQLGGGIGTRGPGETQLETDRRKIYRRIRHVKEQLEDVRRIRHQQRQRRESAPVETVALVGYTNAGKSTLFNALTRAGVHSSPKMFATLDPTLRSLKLPSKREVVVSDTVGFIRNLPHTLVTAFRATLEEVQQASLLLHVSDATSPTADEQRAQVEAVLRELESEGKPRLHVMNKIDLLELRQREALLDDPHTVHVSAVKGIGLDALRDAIDHALVGDPISRVKLSVPQADGKTLAMIDAKARVHSRKYRDGIAEIEADLPESLLRKLVRFVSGPKH